MVSPVRAAAAHPASGHATTVTLTPGLRPEFAVACAEARAGFADVMNLLLVADDVADRPGATARVATLHRLVAFRSVGTWERFVRDVGLVSGVSYEPGQYACLGPDSGGPGHGPAHRVLSGASGGELPDAWRILFPAPEAGARLTFTPVAGATEELVAAADWWVLSRHGESRRQLPREVAWPIRTDAHDTDGRGVDAATARFAATLFLQLVDRSIRVLARSARMAREEDLWLPGYWLRGEAEDGARLWAGPSVAAE